MRKLFTLFVSLAIAVSAMAAPGNLKISAPQKGLAPVRTELAKDKCLKNERAEKMDAHKAERKMLAAPAHKALMSASEAGDTIRLTVDKFELTNWSDASSEWYNWMFMVYSHDEQGDEYYSQFDVYPIEYSWLGTFQTADYSMDAWTSTIKDLSLGLMPYDEEDPDNTNSIFTCSKLAAPEKYAISALLVAEDGQVYTMSGTDLFFPDPKTYEMQGLRLQTVDWGSDIMVTLTTMDNAYFQFDILYDDENPFEYGREYTLSDMELYYTAGYWKHETIYMSDASFVWTKNEDQTVDTIKVHVVADTDDAYDITYVTLKEPESYRNVALTVSSCATLTDLTASDGVFQMMGAATDDEGEEWNVSLACFGEKLIGEFTQEAGQIYDEFTYIGMSDLTVDLTLPIVKIDTVRVRDLSAEPGAHSDDCVLTARIYCYNGICYDVTLTHKWPEITDTVNIEAHNLKLTYDDWEGIYAALCSTPEYIVGLALLEMAETYDGTNAYAQIADRAADVELPVYTVDKAELKFDEADNPQLTASFVAENGTLFNITADYQKPEATREETVIIAAAASEVRPDADEDVTLIKAYAASGDTLALIVINTAELAVGTYSLNLEEVVADRSLVTENANSYWDAAYFDIEDAKLDMTIIEQEGRKYVSLNGTLLCTGEDDEFDHPLYTIIAENIPVKDGLVGDEENLDFVVNYNLDEISLTSQLFEQEGWVLMQGKNADNDAFAIVFFPEAIDSDITLAEGVYTFDQSMSVGTVYASPGLDASGYQAQASFAAKTNVLGFIVGNPWFMETGTVTVAKNADGELTMLVEAKNSYGRDIIINVNDYSQIVEAPMEVHELMDYTSFGFYSVVAVSEDYQMQITINSFSIDGEFTKDDVDLAYSQFYVAAEQAVVNLIDAEMTVTLVDSTYCFDGIVETEQNIKYHVTFAYDIPPYEPQTYDVTVDSYEVTDMFTSQMVYMTDEAAEYEFMLIVNAPAIESGHTYTSEDMDFTMSMCSDHGEFFGLSAASFTYTLGEAVETVYAELTAQNGDLYRITYTKEIQTGFINTVIDRKPVKRFENGRIVIEKDEMRYNVKGQMIE